MLLVYIYCVISWKFESLWRYWKPLKNHLVRFRDIETQKNNKTFILGIQTVTPFTLNVRPTKVLRIKPKVDSSFQFYVRKLYVKKKKKNWVAGNFRTWIIKEKQLGLFCEEKSHETKSKRFDCLGIIDFTRLLIAKITEKGTTAEANSTITRGNWSSFFLDKRNRRGLHAS